jgi:hypothetical protein
MVSLEMPGRSTFRFRVPLAAATTAVALVFTSAAFGTPAASASTAASVPSAVKADMNELLKSVNPSTGLIGTSWWQAAVALSTVETYQQTTGDTSDEILPFLTYLDNKSGAFEDNFDDDTAWWALVWLQYYDVTHGKGQAHG